MATELRPEPSIYSVKFVDTDGIEKIVDIHADGTQGAQDKWAEEHPGTRLVNIWRRK